MNHDDAPWPPEFWQFVEGASDEALSPKDATAFAEFLANNAEAQRLYLAHVQLQVDIRLLCHSQQSLEKALAQIERRLPVTDSLERSSYLNGPLNGSNGKPRLSTSTDGRTDEFPSPVRGQSTKHTPFSPSARSISSLFSGRRSAVRVGLGLATLATIALLVVLNSSKHNKPAPPVATSEDVNEGPKKTAAQQTIESATAKADLAYVNKAGREGFIARIVQGSDDLTWGDSMDGFDFLLRIKPREKINVSSGFVQIEYFSGARIILHGPAVFMALGKASGRLESGRLTGEVPNGNFRLKTPTAEVVDLGTAFGVKTDTALGTDVVVFDGHVQVHSEPNAEGAKSVLDMTEGMAARFRADGTMDHNLKTDTTQFARQIPTTSTTGHPDEICLIDVIAGGNGLESYLAGSIAPFSGEREDNPNGNEWMHMSYEADGRCHPVQSCPMVDSVFIPKADGKQVPIDSGGHLIDLPESSGYAFGTLWARRKESIQNMKSGPDFDFWGFRTLEGIVAKLKTVRIGLVGMHANMGVTFDLQTIQKAHGRAPAEFRGAVSNIENFAVWPPDESPSNPKTRFADCRIYVDGDLRYSRLKFRREDGDEQFAVPLTPKDQFLTVVITDGDGEFRYDHIVLIDPVVTLHKD